MDEWMNGWMNEWMDWWMNGWMDESINGWMNEWINGWMDEWMDEWMNEWMNEWMDEWMNNGEYFGQNVLFFQHRKNSHAYTYFFHKKLVYPIKYNTHIALKEKFLRFCPVQIGLNI